jgi:hypothetical protein
MAMHTEADLARRLEEAIYDGRGRQDGGTILGRSRTTNQEMARKIMGKNFFGIEEAIQYFRVKPKKNERLSVIEWTEEELGTVRDTHVLVAVFPLSILKIRGRVDRRLFYSHEDAWCNQHAFAKEQGEAGWALVRKTPVEHSTSKTWQEQQALLSTDEETPTARVMAYTIIGHFLATGDRLFESIYVRCSDRDSYGDRIVVGYFDRDGLGVSGRWNDDDRDRDIGVSAAGKSN